ncbi:MAG: class I SAM-dependent methyltransferase [Anaerolineales bacterium]|nr:class I SAM-dependent methyltransferase [Anaerolineales bacterium]
MKTYKGYSKANLALWNEWAIIHKTSSLYDLTAFIEGKVKLREIDADELGSIKGKNLLHLMCHMGLDSCLLAEKGANVTAADFSPKALAVARELADKKNMDVRFIESDIYDLPKNLSGKFDIVYTSIGVLSWLKDLKEWAAIISHFLAPGGFFYIHEIHPFALVFNDGPDETTLQVKFPYFGTDEPVRYDIQGSYADPYAKVNQSFSYEWTYTLEGIFTALIQSGLTIQFLHEHAKTHYAMFPFLEESPPGVYTLPDGMPPIPLTFSIRAEKPDFSRDTD